MIQDLHIVAAVDAKTSAIKLLYAGLEAAESREAYEEAGRKFSVVCEISHPLPTRVRYPAQEAADTIARAGEAERQAQAAASRSKNEAAAKRDQAQKLLQEAEQLDPSTAAETAGESAPEEVIEN